MRRAIKLGPDGFPKKGLSKKKAERWLKENDPGPQYIFWKADFYLSQTEKSLNSARKSIIVTFVALGVFFASYFILPLLLGAAGG